MLFRSADLKEIVEGRRTLAFRRWKRPTVRVGGTVKTQMGLVGIDAIELVDPATLTDGEAQEAGYSGLPALMQMFDSQAGTCYRIRLHFVGADPRDEAAEDAVLAPEERARIEKRLAKLDANSVVGPWTAQTLSLIADQPGRVARELAEIVGRDRDEFKEDVRKLKALGLTVSLPVGYRLSARGRTFLGLD